MYLKTTSPQFRNYGKVVDENSRFPVTRTFTELKQAHSLLAYDCKIFIQLLDGIAIIVVQNEHKELEQFVLHRNIILKKSVPFVIIPITQSIVLDIGCHQNEVVEPKTVPLKSSFEYVPIKPKISVSEIYSYYYSAKGNDYVFDGESHYFWELTYVDTGNLTTEIDGVEYRLTNQEMILYFPGQFHKQRIEKQESCSYLTVMFDMNISNKTLDNLKNRIFVCTKELYKLVNDYIRESTIMENDELPYSRDMMISYLQEIILHLGQLDDTQNYEHKISNPIQVNFENELMNEITNYIFKNIYEPISIEEICNHFAISRSTLQTLFKKNLDQAPKQYINEVKMARAQQLILEERYPITEIALKLGFSSIHYFSRKFKSRFGLAPSEFSQSVYKSNHNENE